jgi:hypothetical protein
MFYWAEAIDRTSNPPMSYEEYTQRQANPQAYVQQKKEKAYTIGLSFIANSSPLTQTIPGYGSDTFEVGSQTSVSLDVIHRMPSGLAEYISYSFPVTPGKYPNAIGGTATSNVSVLEAGFYFGSNANMTAFKLGFNMPIWTVESTDSLGNPQGSLSLKTDIGLYAGIVIGRPSMHVEIGYQTLKGSIIDSYSGLTLQFENSGPIGKIGFAF